MLSVIYTEDESGNSSAITESGIDIRSADAA